MKSKIFSYRDVLDNDDFRQDFPVISDVDTEVLGKLIYLRLNSEQFNSEEEVHFYLTENNININDKINSIISIIHFFTSFYNEYFKFINELDLVIDDIYNSQIISKPNLSFEENIKYIFDEIRNNRTSSLVYKYKEEFTPIINDITYTTNIKLIKDEFPTYKRVSTFNSEINTFISTTTVNIELLNKGTKSEYNSFIFQLTKDDIDSFIELLSSAKEDMIRADKIIKNKL